MNAAPLSKMRETLRYVKMRRKGHDFSPEIEAAQEETKDLLIQRISSVRSNLLRTRQQAVSEAQNLLAEENAIDLFEPARFRLDSLEAVREPVKAVEERLMKEAQLGESELVKKQAATILLQAELEKFKKELKKAEGKHYGFEIPLIVFAEKGIRQTYGSKHL